MTYYIHVKLLSDATFGRGDGVAGLVDQEVEHDPQTGLPFIRGRTLKGLLVEACADIFYALGENKTDALDAAAAFLFGGPGSDLQSQAAMHLGPARLPRKLRQAVAADTAAGRLQPAEVLDALTAIRRQTAVDEQSGTPDDGSLRAMRVLLKDTELDAVLFFSQDPRKTQTAALPLLAACVASLHRGGTGRNRGRGRLQARLFEEDANITETQLGQFRALFNSPEPA